MTSEMHILQEIRISDFKSFTDPRIRLHNVTCFVGPNESGKTNFLDAVYHLAPQNQNKPFEPDEFRIGAPGYPSGEIRIDYIINLNSSITNRLADSLPGITGRPFVLTKRGKPKETPTWDGAASLSASSFPDIIQIVNKSKFSRRFGTKTSETVKAKERQTTGWFINDTSVDLRTSRYRRMLNEGVIVLLKGNEKLTFLNERLKDVILGNIKLYRWEYKEENFLKETVPIADFLEDPTKYVSVMNMFLISGWKKEEFSDRLTNQTTTVYANLLSAVERDINALIRRHWSTHKSLKIKLQHKGDFLTIHLHETGSDTPPEFRSDGLKWFLTFLINFRAQSTTITNYVLLIDEPGLYLHPQGQKDVLEEIEELSYHNQIIYTTHQTFLINKNRPERVRIITRATETKGHLSRNPFYSSQFNDIDNPKTILTDRLLREALGFKVSDVSPINEKNILVEGVLDREMLHVTNQLWQIINLNDTSIVFCRGAPEIVRYAGWLKSNDLQVLCFYDSDDIGRSCCTRNDQVEASKKRQVRDFTTENTNETLEDLIPETIFDVAYKEWSNKWDIGAPAHVNKPRMKNMAGLFNGDRKVEMKHSLEDIIVDHVKRTLKEKEKEFGVFKEILKDFQTRL